MCRPKYGEIICTLNFYIFAQNPVVYHSSEAPTEEHLSSSIDFFGFDKNKFDFFGHFFSLAFVRNDKGKASFFFAVGQSIVRTFSFSFKLS